MPGNHAPIAYFAFNRPEHTARTLTALSANAEAIDTDLQVFVDGARNEAERSVVAEVVRIAEAAIGFRSVKVKAADSNRGLYRAITRGVGEVVSVAGRVIVVEDDILVSPHFLAYMNEALERYEAEPGVGSIHGYSPPIAGLPAYFFLRGGDCWGWATWVDRWSLFNPDARALLFALVERGELGPFASTHGIHGLRHLIRRSRNRNQSWAAHWNASLFLQARLTLHPGKSFVQNIGNDGSGTHSMASAQYGTSLRMDFPPIPSAPIQHDPRSARMLRDFYDETINFRVFGSACRAIYLAFLQMHAHALSRTQGLCRAGGTAGGTAGSSVRGATRND